jgi:hypothetical protein
MPYARDHPAPFAYWGRLSGVVQHLPPRAEDERVGGNRYRRRRWVRPARSARTWCRPACELSESERAWRADRVWAVLRGLEPHTWVAQRQRQKRNWWGNLRRTLLRRCPPAYRAGGTKDCERRRWCASCVGLGVITSQGGQERVLLGTWVERCYGFRGLLG